jgi:hypothetical protein
MDYLKEEGQCILRILGTRNVQNKRPEGVYKGPYFIIDAQVMNGPEAGRQIGIVLRTEGPQAHPATSTPDDFRLAEQGKGFVRVTVSKVLFGTRRRRYPFIVYRFDPVDMRSMAYDPIYLGA